jgi:hypothetical protein
MLYRGKFNGTTEKDGSKDAFGALNRCKTHLLKDVPENARILVSHVGSCLGPVPAQDSQNVVLLTGDIEACIESLNRFSASRRLTARPLAVCSGRSWRRFLFVISASQFSSQ